MIKRIILVLILSNMGASCGKKGDPVYVDPLKKTELQKVIINKA